MELELSVPGLWQLSMIVLFWTLELERVPNTAGSHPLKMWSRIIAGRLPETKATQLGQIDFLHERFGLHRLPHHASHQPRFRSSKGEAMSIGFVGTHPKPFPHPKCWTANRHLLFLYVYASIVCMIVLASLLFFINFNLHHCSYLCTCIAVCLVPYASIVNTVCILFIIWLSPIFTPSC